MLGSVGVTRHDRENTREETVTTHQARAESNLDLYKDAVLIDPYPAYRALREAGAVVWLPQHDMFVFPRYQEVREALRNWQVYSSASGVMMNQPMNDALRGITLCTDGAEHHAMRRVLVRPLAPDELRALKTRIEDEAEALVARLVARRHFDAAADLAQHLPITIVSELVGLPEEGREHMLEWAAANFNCFGPLNQRTLDAFETVKEMIHYAFTQAVPGKLKPGGWAQMIYDAAERGELRPEQCPVMMNDYMGPSLDTTIFATTSAILLFGQHPEQWQALCDDPELIPGAVNEVIRLESPIQAFSRMVTQDQTVDGVAIPAGSRVMVHYASANRCERKWDEPERFDIRRRAHDHLGFGFGPHACAGMNLARLEISALLGALSRRVKRFELGTCERAMNNVLRGLQRLDVTVH
jgi:cytochrome P450